MKYVYFIELRGRRLALLKSSCLVTSAKELYRQVVSDPENFQRVYDLATPSDVCSVLLKGDIFEFLICADMGVFKKWLKSEILRESYQCHVLPALSDRTLDES